jgi:hypothetical protein
MTASPRIRQRRVVTIPVQRRSGLGADSDHVSTGKAPVTQK